MNLLSRIAETISGLRARLAFPSPRSSLGGEAASRLVEWYAGRDRRERILLLVGSVVVAVYVAFAGVWQPLSAMRETALADIAKYEAVAARITAAGTNLSLAVLPSAALPDAAVITESATVIGLTIRRLEPEGDRTRIEVEDADFAVLVDWLARLETEHALHVATIEIDRRPPPGIVSARLSVER